VSAERLLEIFSLMERRDGEWTSAALCTVAAEFLAVDGAGIVLSSDNGDLTSLCASNDTAGALMDLEIVVREGPAVDACRGRAVNEPNLLDAAGVRWAMYAPPALALGARAVFGYSIRIGAVRFGALSLYRTTAGPLSASQETDAYLMASVVGRDILTERAGGLREDLVSELDGASMLDFSVHQAAGMVAVQGSMSVGDALVNLRAHAFASSRELRALAVSVINRDTRFDPDSRTWSDESDGVSSER
jgi:hypothetical protein